MSDESADKSARILVRVRLRQTGSTTAADCRYSSGKLNGRYADILATILAKMSVSVFMSVSASVPWNSSFTKQQTVRKRSRPIL